MVAGVSRVVVRAIRDIGRDQRDVHRRRDRDGLSGVDRRRPVAAGSVIMPQSTAEAPQEFTDDLISCPRCSANHEAIVWKPFKDYPVVDADGTVWNWWSMCPFNGEPILLCRIPDEVR